jgi:hypothetical protein
MTSTYAFSFNEWVPAQAQFTCNVIAPLQVTATPTNLPVVIAGQTRDGFTADESFLIQGQVATTPYHVDIEEDLSVKLLTSTGPLGGVSIIGTWTGLGADVTLNGLGQATAKFTVTSITAPSSASGAQSFTVGIQAKYLGL